MAIDVGNKGKGVTPELNVTPLVDVVLVLLIIFMIVTPQLENDIQVDLPQILNIDPDKKKDFDSLEVSLAKDGRIVIDKVIYRLDELPSYLKAVRQESPSRKLALRVDKGHRFKDVRDLIAKIREAGYNGAALMVSERQKKES